MGIKTNLVLGGSGTIGSALCNHLEKKGEKVVNLDLKTGFDIRFHSLEPFKKVDYVWFLAWEVGGAKFLTKDSNLINIIHNNTILCEKVFSFLNDTHIPFMFTSSQLATTETPYGITKLLGEKWTQILNGQTVRFWNVYGWEEPGERSHVIPDLILQALTKKSIYLMTNGQEERQFIYMDDCVENMVLVRNNNIKKTDITTGIWISIEKIAQIIGKALNVPVILGENKGYFKAVDPIYINPNCQYETTIEQGIFKIIENAKLYLNKLNN